MSDNTSDPAALRRDLALVRDADRGAPKAVDALGDRLRQVPVFVGRILRRLGRRLSAADRDDVQQDVCVGIIRRLDSYHGLASLDAWIYRFCQYTLQNRFRAGRIRTEELDFEVADERMEPASNDEFVDRVIGVVRTMGGLEAEVIRLRCFEGLPFAEIGERLGKKTATVKTLFHRGVERVRARVGAPESVAPRARRLGEEHGN
ncbi:MAG: sigma-70 family RNA polymerase sigma factor [Planctomycetota bacterium]